MTERKSREEVLQEVIEAVADQLSLKPEDKAKVTEKTSFNDDLNADSLDLVELVMSLEEQYGIEVSDAEAETLTTVGAAVEFIMKKLRD